MAGQSYESWLQANRGRIEQLRRNPRSVFVSYGWDDDSHRKWVAGVASSLKDRGFEVVLDEIIDLDVEHVFTLGMYCRNFLIIGSTKYTETCLLGNVPCSQRYSQVPSFSTPFLPGNEEWSLENSVNAANILIYVCKRLIKEPELDINNLVIEGKTEHDLKEKEVVFRVFWEGWGVDENQSILLYERSVDRIVTVFRSGSHCICRYPIIDFSKDENYDRSMSNLVSYLHSKPRTEDKSMTYPFLSHSDAENLAGDSDETSCSTQRSKNVQVMFWRLSGQQVTILRTGKILSDGRVSISMHRFSDWERVQ